MADKKDVGSLVKPLSESMGVDTGLPLNEALRSANLTNMKVLPPNTPYVPKESLLWVNLFWRIAEDTIGRAVYNSKFTTFNETMEMGGDLAEEFIRLKKPQDRTQLPNSDLLVDYVDKVDLAIHRINHLERFATTFLQNEGRKVFQSWDTLQTFISSAIDNLHQSYNVNTDRQIMQMLSDGYANGQINNLVLPDSSSEKAAYLNTIWDNFTIEPSQDYVGFNLHSSTASDKLENVSQSAPYLIIEAALMRNIEFLDALELYFTRTAGNNNDLFSRVIKVKEFPNPTPGLEPVDGYTPVADPQKVRAMFIDEDFLKFRTQFMLTTEFMNAATLKTNVYVHYDNMLSFSPFKNAVTFTM